jgi:hypothetical protein
MTALAKVLKKSIRSAITELWVDGGVIGHNPSKHGGVYAWVAVSKHGMPVEQQSGLILPVNPPKPITNNVAELTAALIAIKDNPDFAGTLFTDSTVTLCRLLDSDAFDGVPAWVVTLTLRLRRNRKWTAVLVSGHPTRKELAAGASKEGRIVSKWNVLADKLCQEQDKKFLEGRT